MKIVTTITPDWSIEVFPEFPDSHCSNILLHSNGKSLLAVAYTGREMTDEQRVVIRSINIEDQRAGEIAALEPKSGNPLLIPDRRDGSCYLAYSLFTKPPRPIRERWKDCLLLQSKVECNGEIVKVLEAEEVPQCRGLLTRNSSVDHVLYYQHVPLYNEESGNGEIWEWSNGKFREKVVTLKSEPEYPTWWQPAIGDIQCTDYGLYCYIGRRRQAEGPESLAFSFDSDVFFDGVSQYRNWNSPTTIISGNSKRPMLFLGNASPDRRGMSLYTRKEFNPQYGTSLASIGANEGDYWLKRHYPSWALSDDQKKLFVSFTETNLVEAGKKRIMLFQIDVETLLETLKRIA